MPFYFRFEEYFILLLGPCNLPLIWYRCNLVVVVPPSADALLPLLFRTIAARQNPEKHRCEQTLGFENENLHRIGLVINCVRRLGSQLPPPGTVAVHGHSARARRR